MAHSLARDDPHPQMRNAQSDRDVDAERVDQNTGVNRDCSPSRRLSVAELGTPNYIKTTGPSSTEWYNRVDPKVLREHAKRMNLLNDPGEERVRREETPEIANRRPNKYCTIREKLGAEDKELAMTVFPEFDIRFLDQSYSNHPFAAANRRLSTEILLERGSRGCSAVIDIGGNWADHVLNNRAHIHSCSPLLDLRDASRWTERRNRCETALTRCARRGNGLAFYNEHRGQEKCAMWCQSKAQDCDVQAEYGIAVHSVYDIDFDTIGEIMVKHGMNSLYGCFTFFPELLKDGLDFELPSQGLFVRKDEKQGTIEFAFKGEATAAYAHDLRNYMKYLLRSYTCYNGIYFFYELLENRAGTQFFKFVRAHGPWTGRTKLIKYLWNGYKNCVLVKTLHLKEFEGTMLRERGDWGLVTGGIIVPKDLYDRALEYALSFKEVDNCFRDLVSYIRSINNRVIVSGLNVTVPTKIGADSCYFLAVSVFCAALKMAKENAIVIERVKRYNAMKESRRNWGPSELLMGTAISLTDIAIRSSIDKVFDPVREGLIRLNEIPSLDPKASAPCPYLRVEEYVGSMVVRLMGRLPWLSDIIDDGYDWPQAHPEISIEQMGYNPEREGQLRDREVGKFQPDQIELQEAEERLQKKMEKIKAEMKSGGTAKDAPSEARGTADAVLQAPTAVEPQATAATTATPSAAQTVPNDRSDETVSGETAGIAGVGVQMSEGEAVEKVAAAYIARLSAREGTQRLGQPLSLHRKIVRNADALENTRGERASFAPMVRGRGLTLTRSEDDIRSRIKATAASMQETRSKRDAQQRNKAASADTLVASSQRQEAAAATDATSTKTADLPGVLMLKNLYDGLPEVPLILPRPSASDAIPAVIKKETSYAADDVPSAPINAISVGVTGGDGKKKSGSIDGCYTSSEIGPDKPARRRKRRERRKRETALYYAPRPNSAPAVPYKAFYGALMPGFRVDRGPHERLGYLGAAPFIWALRPNFMNSSTIQHYQSAVGGAAFLSSTTLSSPELTDLEPLSGRETCMSDLSISTSENAEHSDYKTAVEQHSDIEPPVNHREENKDGAASISPDSGRVTAATVTPSPTAPSKDPKETGAKPKVYPSGCRPQRRKDTSDDSDHPGSGRGRDNPRDRRPDAVSRQIDTPGDVGEKISQRGDDGKHKQRPHTSKGGHDEAVRPQRHPHSNEEKDRGFGARDDPISDADLRYYEKRMSAVSSRLNEYSTYLDKEYRNVVSETARHWKTCYNQFTGMPNTINVRACGDKEIGFLAKASDTGILQAYEIKGCKKPSGDYDYAFDGVKLVRLEQLPPSQGSGWIVTDRDKAAVGRFLMVWKELELVQCVKLRRHVNGAPKRIAPVILVDGVPGCGKTRELLTRAKPGDLVVTVARKTAQEMKSRLVEMKKDAIEVRTVDSYVLNSRKQHETVWLDEGLMVHPGVIDLLVGYSMCSKMFVYGDRNQLNFISRVPGFVLNHHIFEDFESVEMRNLSYRVPQDVAARFAALYDGGFKTTNKVRLSLTKKTIANIHQVGKAHEKYLTFTQEEKKELLKKGLKDVNTIHEVQGMTFKDVALVRLNPKSISLFESRPHTLVGLSRHTATFTYYTVKDDDPVAKVMVEGYKKKEVVGTLNKTTKGVVQSREMLRRTVRVPMAECDSARRREIADNIITSLGNYDMAAPDYHYEEYFAEPYSYLPAHAAANSLADPINALQTYYDEVFPGASCDSQRHDEIQIETSDIRLDLENVTLDFSKDGTHTRRLMDKDRGCESVLRTAQPNKRTSTFRQQCLALQKRNCDTPANGYAVDLDETTQRVLKNFKEKFLRKDYRDVLKTFSGEPVLVETNNTWHWVNGQEMTKLERIDMDTWEGAADAGQRYEMMIKSEAKNKLEPNAYMEYLVPQNIIHHSTTLNAVFGPVFKILFSRFQEILDPKICVMLRKSLSELEAHMNAWVPVNENIPFFEMDFSKFDKCQTEVCFTIEMRIWELLGLDDMLYHIWKIGHFTSSALDFRNGIKAILFFQRKSGDAATAFGNTLVSMIALSDTTSIDSLIAGYFIGDDSLIFTMQREDQSRAIDAMRTIFNLTAKLLEMRTAYFCSMFVTNGPDGRVLVPDPLKRIERLGKSMDFISEGHSSFMAGVRERYISFKEIIQPLNDENIYDQVADGLNERYGGSGYAAKQALSALMTLANDFQQFRRIWSDGEPVRVSKTTKVIRKVVSALAHVFL